jgi:hypothetical protein
VCLKRQRGSAKPYAEAVEARSLLVAVAPNRTSNEDLIGYRNPLDRYAVDTQFGAFLREAARDTNSRRSRTETRSLAT